MSSFLSALENVSRQCLNVRRYLINMEEESRALERALKKHNYFLFFWFVLYRKIISIKVVSQLHLIFGTIVTLLTLDDALGMTSSAAR